MFRDECLSPKVRNTWSNESSNLHTSVTVDAVVWILEDECG